MIQALFEGFLDVYELGMYEFESSESLVTCSFVTTFWTSVDSQTKDMRRIESFKRTLQSRHLK